MRYRMFFKAFVLAVTVGISGCEKIGSLMGVAEKQSSSEPAAEFGEVIEAAEGIRLEVTELYDGIRMPYEVRKSLNEMRAAAQECIQDTTDQCTAKLSKDQAELRSRLPQLQKNAEFEKVMTEVSDARRKLEARRKEALQMSIMYPPSDSVKAEYPLTPEQPVEKFKVPEAKLTATADEIQEQKIAGARQWIESATTEAARLKDVRDAYAKSIDSGW